MGAYQQWGRKTWNIIIKIIHHSSRTEMRNDRIVMKSFTKRVCTGVKKFCEVFRICSNSGEMASMESSRQEEKPEKKSQIDHWVKDPWMLEKLLNGIQYERKKIP